MISASATLLESFVSGITGIACLLRQHPFGCSETGGFSAANVLLSVGLPRDLGKQKVLRMFV